MGPSSTPGFSDDSIRQMLLDARRMALRWCRSVADAEDVAQEAVMRLIAVKETPVNIPDARSVSRSFGSTFDSPRATPSA